MEKFKVNQHFGISEILARVIKGVAQCGISNPLYIYQGLKGLSMPPLQLQH